MADKTNPDLCSFLADHHDLLLPQEQLFCLLRSLRITLAEGDYSSNFLVMKASELTFEITRGLFACPISSLLRWSALAMQDWPQTLYPYSTATQNIQVSSSQVISEAATKADPLLNSISSPPKASLIVACTIATLSRATGCEM